MRKVDIWTDGACDPNPGPGGWGAVLTYNRHTKELSGGKTDTTNNEMELVAVHEALKALREPCRVTVHSDSRLVIKWLTKEWQCNAYPELRDEILAMGHDLSFAWVKAHNGDRLNERADTLAKAAIP